MQKGKYGICLWFYAVLAFILAFLGQTLLGGLLLAFVILAERDEWLTKQVMQAFLLNVAFSIVGGVIGLVDVFDSIPVLDVVFGWTFRIVRWAVEVLVLIFAIIGCVRTARGQDAEIPIASMVADRAFGYVKQKVVYQSYPNGYPAPGAAPQQPYAAPQAPVPPQQPQPAASAPQPPQAPVPPQQPPQA